MNPPYIDKNTGIVYRLQGFGRMFGNFDRVAVIYQHTTDRERNNLRVIPLQVFQDNFKETTDREIADANVDRKKPQHIRMMLLAGLTEEQAAKNWLGVMNAKKAWWQK